ncbi:disulfide bond formation protein B [bacterium]|nr:disulfide bond formation protein B [bacterium]
MGFVLIGAFGYQFIKHEDPCPLCLLQRLAMIGIMVGCVLNLRFGINTSHYGLILLSSIFGSGVSLRQIALHVCPQFDTFGEPVFGFELYTWAAIVFYCSVFAVAILLYLKGLNKDPHQGQPKICIWNQITFIFCILIVISEIITTLQICGVTACQG